jgi:hypothetical protein
MNEAEPTPRGGPARRTVLGAALLAVIGVEVVGTGVASTVTRPRRSGDGYVRYEELYRSGDSLNDAIWRLPRDRAAVITFPEGRFEFADFTNDSRMYYSGIGLPKWCRGIAGSGKGALGASAGTVFAMGPGSSTTKAAVPAQDGSTPIPQYLMKASSPDHPMEFSDFHLEGTDQGHIYGGLQVYDAVGGTTFTDLLVTGWAGDSGSPPGETAGLTAGGRGSITYLRCEADGRRERGGEIFGATGLSFQGTAHSTMKDCVSHYVRASPANIYLTFDSLIVGCIFDATSTSAAVGVGNGGSVALNIERCSGITLRDCVLDARGSLRHNTGTNVAFSTDDAGRRIDGVQYSAVGGSLVVENPTFNAMDASGLFSVQSYTPYGSGDTLVNPPVVRDAHGRPLRYEWIHGETRVIG